MTVYFPENVKNVKEFQTYQYTFCKCTYPEFSVESCLLRIPLTSKVPLGHFEYAKAFLGEKIGVVALMIPELIMK